MANPSLQIGNSNWAIKKDNLLGYSTAGTRFLPIPITMTRASAGTRVNPQGLVETVELLGSEEVTNGDFSNGLTGWTENGGSYATIVSGALNSNNPDAGNWYAENISQNVSFVNGTTYKLTFKAKNISGNLNLRITQGANAMASLDLTSSFVDYTYFYTANADNGSIRLFCNSAVGEFQIDDISVKESTRNDLARVDYTGSTSSLLAEPQRTNLVTYSEDFSDSSWSKSSSITLTPNDSISPNGLTNSSKLNFTSVSTTNALSFNFLTIVDDYSCSIFVKYIDTQFIQLWFGSTGFSGGNVNFDLINGTKNELSGATGSIKDFGNGWYKITMTKASAGGTTSALAIVTVSSLSSGRFGDEVDGSVHIWGAQLEQGSFPTSYIPTSGSTVTRVQDQYSKTGISDKINSTEGVLFVEMAALANDGVFRIITLSDGGTTNRVSLIYNTSSNSIRVMVVSTSTVFDTSNSVTSTLDFHKIAIKWKLNDFAVWIDGVEVATDTSGATPVGLDRIVFDVGNGSLDFFGKVKQLQVFKTALTDSELATLTT